MAARPRRLVRAWALALGLLCAACARSHLPLGPPDAAPDGGSGTRDAGHGGPDGGLDGGLDAGLDAGEPACTWGPGMLGAWRVPGADAPLPSIFHIDAEGALRSTVLWHEGGGAYGMGIARRDADVGVAWRVRREDGVNLLFFGIVRRGCLAGEPAVVHEGGTLQSFRGNLVATASGWLVLWVADGGLWARSLAADGAPLGEASTVAALADARFSAASRGDRVGILFTAARGTEVRLLELSVGGAAGAETLIAVSASSCLEPRLVALEEGWGGAFIAGTTLWTFALDRASGTVSLLPVGEACVSCVAEPSYILPAVATDGRRVGVVYAALRGGERQLVLALNSPASGVVERTTAIAREGMPDIHWPALGVDGTRWVVAYDLEASGVRVQFIGDAGEPTHVTGGARGVQRLPALIRAP